MSGAILTVQTQLIFELSGKCVGDGQGGNTIVKYWDPQASSVKKFVDLGLGTAEQYNFPALANKVLGQANQLHQFQSSGETGYIWGSKCTPIYDENDNTRIIDTTCDPSTKPGSNPNILTEIPRAYDRERNISLGSIYNFTALTAESPHESDAYVAEDSICPSGWRIPDYYTYSPSKTWGKLLSTAYSVAEGSVSNSTRLPLSMVYAGYYYTQDNTGSVQGTGSTQAYPSSLSRGISQYSGINIIKGGSVNFNYAHGKIHGATVRCVKR